MHKKFPLKIIFTNMTVFILIKKLLTSYRTYMSGYLAEGDTGCQDEDALSLFNFNLYLKHV